LSTASEENSYVGRKIPFENTVQKTKGFSREESLKVIEGPNPYGSKATVYFSANLTLKTTKFSVDTSLAPWGRVNTPAPCNTNRHDNADNFTRGTYNG
jgi:hypothetical protein